MKKKKFLNPDNRTVHYIKELQKEEKYKMVEHSVVLLEWAWKNKNKECSLTTIARETNIPRMSIRWLMLDYSERGCDSILAKSARYEGFMFVVYESWNKNNKYKRRKKMIDAVKIFEPWSDKDY